MEANITIAGERYEIGKLTLGDMRLLSKHFGIVDMTKLTELAGSPDLLAGMAYLGFMRKHPEWEHERLMNEVNDVVIEDLGDQEMDEPEVEADPKSDAAPASV